MAKRGHNYHELSNGHGEAGSTHSQLHPLFAMRRAIQFISISIFVFIRYYSARILTLNFKPLHFNHQIYSIYLLHHTIDHACLWYVK